MPLLPKIASVDGHVVEPPGLWIAGMASRQIMFETDYPHGDSTFPNSAEVAKKLASAAGLSEHETWQFVRGNAIECYGLSRYGITK